MADTAEDLAKTKKSFMAVGIALIVFTFVAYALGQWPIFDFGPPGATPMDFILALGLSAVKASLVALIFMHLNHEKGIIYKILLFTFFFFLGLMILTLFTLSDPIVEQFDTIKSTKGALFPNEL